MKIYPVLALFLMVLCLGAFGYLLLRMGAGNTAMLWYIFSATILKIAAIVYLFSRNMMSFAHSGTPYHKFLIFVAIFVFHIILSFAIDFFLVYLSDPKSFDGVQTDTYKLNHYELAFKFSYFSLLMFTNIGVANIIPVKIPAEALVMMQAVMSFATIMVVLSNHTALRESIGQYKQKKAKKSEKPQ